MIIRDYYLLCQDDDQSPKDADEVNEQFKGMLHKVLAAHAALLNDQLGVI